MNRHASVEQPGTITPKPDMLRDLNHRGITVAAEKLSAQLGTTDPENQRRSIPKRMSLASARRLTPMRS